MSRAAHAAAPTIADIRAARHRLASVGTVTPLLESEQLNALAGRRVLVKAENLQRTGSFKFRGAWSRMTLLPDAEHAAGVVAFSSGNHAQAVACAARILGTRATIVMPSDAPRAKIETTREYGAEVVTYDRATEDRDAIAAELSAARGLVLIKPFDERFVIAGQGTAGLEIAEQAAALGIDHADLLVCCAGGGLASGIALACEAEAKGLRIRTVEPEAFDDMARSLAVGSPMANAATTGSVQDALLTPMPGTLTFPILQNLAGPGLAVSDDEALRAVALAWRWLRIVLEPGGAAALAAALFRADQIEGEAVIVTASGGNVDREMFLRALQQPD